MPSAERSLRLKPEHLTGDAIEVGKKAAESTRRFFRRHKDLIPSGEMEEIVRREESWSQLSYLSRRSEGLENDEASVEPGISIYLNEDGLETLKEKASKHGAIKEEQILEHDNGVFSVSFEKGMYHSIGEGILFSQEEVFDFDNNSQLEDMFWIRSSNVVRVLGTGGMLWQNPDFNPDGTPKL